MKIGFVGLGVMGSGIASNLLNKGFNLSFYARNIKKAERHLKLGATSVTNLAALSRVAEGVVLSLPNTGDVEAVLFGADGLSELQPGSVVIDTSTISAVATTQFSERLSKRGIALLDAPVSGGQKGAESGTLSCMVGGPIEAFERCLPIFQAFASAVTRIGDSGAGQLCKTCNQMCVVASMLGAAEMVALSLKSGIDPMVVRQVLLGGSAKSVVMENHTKRLIERTFEPGFRTELLLKDLRLAVDVLRERGVYAPVTTTAESLFSALVQSGRGELDWSSIGELLQELSGVSAQ